MRHTQGGLFWDKAGRFENEMAFFETKMKCHFLWRCVVFFVFVLQKCNLDVQNPYPTRHFTIIFLTHFYTQSIPHQYFIQKHQRPVGIVLDVSPTYCGTRMLN